MSSTIKLMIWSQLGGVRFAVYRARLPQALCHALPAPQSVSLNVTANCPHIGTGLPFYVPGTRRHDRFTSLTAASSRRGKPLDCFTLASPTRPFSST